MLVKLNASLLMVKESVVKNQNGSEFESIRPAVQDPELMPNLIKNNVVVEGTAPQRQGLLMQLLIAKLPSIVNHFVIHVLYAEYGWRCWWQKSSDELW